MQQLFVPKNASVVKSYPIRTVAKLTGLTPDLIRAWEKRYGVVDPVRGPRGARLYSDGDIQRLTLLARAVDQGRSIGDVAGLDPTALGALVAPTATPVAARVDVPRLPDTDLSPYLAALERLDVGFIEARLSEALLALGPTAFAQYVATPLLAEIGRRWAQGQLSIAQEHLMSTAMRNLLGSLSRSPTDSSRPAVLLAAPSGERHEIGLLIVAVLAAERGVRVVHLGSDVPAEDIIDTALRLSAAAVGLSLTATDNRIAAARAVAEINAALPAAMQIWLGGSDARYVAALLPTGRAHLVQDIDTLQARIAALQPMQPSL